MAFIDKHQDSFRLTLVKSTLAAALFLAPLSAVIAKFLPLVAAAAAAELLLLVLLLGFVLQYLLRGDLRVARPVLLDIWMLGWLLYLAIAMDTTYELHQSWFTAVVALRYVFIVPVVYFVFRLAVRTPEEFSDCVDFYQKLLKISVIYLLVEACMVNFFGMSAPLETFFSRTGEAARLYDPMLGGRWLKPAGPIHGSQNASFLALISFFCFLLEYQSRRLPRDLVWAGLAICAFFTSATVTALIAFACVVMALGAFSKKRVYTKLFPFVGLGALGLVVHFRREVLAFRDRGGDKSTAYEKLTVIAKHSFETLNEYVWSLGFGKGWPNHLDSRQWSLSRDLAAHAPPEIFLFRLGYFLGSAFLWCFLIFHVFVYFRAKKTCSYQLDKEYLSRSRLVLVAVLALFVSTIHYETFTRFGFSYFYAFCLVGLALLDRRTNVAGSTTS